MLTSPLLRCEGPAGSTTFSALEIPGSSIRYRWQRNPRRFGDALAEECAIAPPREAAGRRLLRVGCSALAAASSLRATF